LVLASAGVIAICTGIPFIASLLARRLWPLLKEGSQTLIAMMLVPTLSACLTIWAVTETFREALNSPEDGYQLVMFTWVVAGGMLIVVALPLGFLASKLAKRLASK
jgi:hypothetical protein